MPDVGQELNAMLPQEGDEFLEGPRGMTDRPDRPARATEWFSPIFRFRRRRVAHLGLTGDNLSADLKRRGPDPVLPRAHARARVRHVRPAHPSPSGLELGCR